VSRGGMVARLIAVRTHTAALDRGGRGTARATAFGLGTASLFHGSRHLLVDGVSLRVAE
jgi:hypothetical protein